MSIHRSSLSKSLIKTGSWDGNTDFGISAVSLCLITVNDEYIVERDKINPFHHLASRSRSSPYF